MEAPLIEPSWLRVVVLPDPEVLSREAAAFLIEQSRKYISSEGRFAIALSGGSTPGRLYELLGSLPFKDRVDWGRVHFFWTDERCVPKEDEASNFRLAFDALLSRIPVSETSIHRMKGEKGPAKAAEDYEKEIKDFFGTPGYPSFDLILLGVGEDGHTASLFPGSDSLQETVKWVIPVYPEKSGLNRITLSLPVLNHADQILFLVSGMAKATILREILGKDGNKERFPAGMIRPVLGKVTWLIDKEAASELTGSQFPSFLKRG